MNRALSFLVTGLALLALASGRALATDPDVISPVVNYQYLDSLAVSLPQPSVVSPLVSYQYFDWPGDENLKFQTSALVSFFFNPAGGLGLNGFVYDQQSGQPLANATVNLGGILTTTNANGYYLFQGLAAGAKTMTASKPGFAIAATTVNPATTLSRDIYLSPDFSTNPTATLSGHVRAAATGALLAGVTVTLSNGASTVTDSGGAYALPSFPSGVYTVSVPAGGGYLVYNQKLSLAGDCVREIGLVTGQSVYGSDTRSGYSIDPVNTATGNYIYSRADISLPGPGIAFEFERNYNSQSGTDGPLGFGWNHSYNVKLTVDGAGNATIIWGDGKTETYFANGSGGFTPQYGVFDTLAANPDGTYALRKKSQTAWNFGASGRLVSIVDKNDNTIALAYSGANLAAITDAAGRSIAFVCDAGNHITKVTDPIDRTVQFAYDASGNLASATDSNGSSTTYTYDANHQVLTVVDPRGNTVVTNTYDAGKRVVTSQQDAKGGQTGYVYDEANKKTTVTQPLGRVTVDHYDTLQRLIQQDDASGNSTRYGYDGAGNRISVTAKNGCTVSFAYDARGNVTGKSDPFGATTAITYDAQNNPLSRMDALGNVTSFEYDAKGNLTKTTDALDGVTTVTYNSRGQPLIVTNANNAANTSGYDTAGNLTSIVDALGNATTCTYDGAGRKLTITDALNHVTTYVYDHNDNVLSVTDPAGKQTISTYDGNNNRLTVKDRRGNTTTYAYDVKDLLTTTTDPLGHVVTNIYDALDQKIKVTDARDGITQFAYDSVGNLISVTDAVGQTTQFTSDANGNRLTATTPLGETVRFTYDALDRLVQTVDPLGNTTRNEYDSLGRRTKTTDANNHSTTFGYDALGRLTTVTDAAGGTVTYTYDPVGNRIGMTDPNGHNTTYAYDPLNRLVQTTDPSGGTTTVAYDAVGNRVSRQDAKAQTTTYAYDINNRLSGITYPLGTPVGFSYDENGNRLGMTDSLGASSYQYDALNRLTTATDAYGQAVGYSYDANGNRTSLAYPDGKAVAYGYDAANRLTAVTDWLNGVTAYSYDAAGSLVGTTNPNATTVGYSYDAAGQLTGLSNAQPNATVISSYTLTLDGVGNHTQSTQNEPLAPLFAAQTVNYTYDSDNRLTSAGPTNFTYDANGNLTAKGADTFNYDFENRLTQSSIGGATAHYRYDGMGNRKSMTSGGVTKRFVLDTNAPLSQVLAETDETGAIAAYYVYGRGLISRITPAGSARYYHYDVRGSTIALSDASGSVTDSYAFDPFGKTANTEGSSTNPFKYVGRLGVSSDSEDLLYIRARFYCPSLGRFLTKDLLAGTETENQSLHRYIYGLNNPVRFIDPSGYFSQETFWKGTGQLGMSVLQFGGALVKAAGGAVKAALSVNPAARIGYGAHGTISALDGINDSSKNLLAGLTNVFANSITEEPAVTPAEIEGIYDPWLRNDWVRGIRDANKVAGVVLGVKDLAKHSDDIVDITNVFLKSNGRFSLETLTFAGVEFLGAAEGHISVLETIYSLRVRNWPVMAETLVPEITQADGAKSKIYKK